MNLEDLKLKEIESQSMNWKTGIMTTTRYGKVVKKERAMPPKSSMYYMLRSSNERSS